MITTILWIVAVLLAIWVIYDVLENNKRLSTGTSYMDSLCSFL